jgi:hypothetical protein
MAQAKAVHRPLSLHSPRLEGADIKALQSSINKQYTHLKIDREIEVDGQLGGATFDAAEQISRALGVVGAAARKLKRGTLSEGTQKLIRGRHRTVAETIAGRARAHYRTKLRKRYAKSAGAVAIEKALPYVGAHEEPSGSNWGKTVAKFITFCGYSGPVYWCGCFACFVVVQLGGAKIPNRIRMGYAPYITADALAGVNGFTAVKVANGRKGDVGCLWGGEHVVTLREDVKPGDTVAFTIEGNTSAADGSQSNGGEVALKERPLSEFDAGIFARPAWR